jgi:mannose-6-phosphate isomerase
MEKPVLYPLRFKPILKYRLWGGDKLGSALNKEVTGEQIGESWEISAVDGDKTIVYNGDLKGRTIPELIDQFKEDFLGKKVYAQYGQDFPLLIKFIDAAAPLSIQVHPGDEIARERHNSYGKNEMWYIMDAEPDASITIGFNRKLDKKSYQSHVAAGTIDQMMNITPVEKGDAFFIPTGRVHAIGKGVLLAEIQQSSDVTYRIYDYNRIDKQTGELRELHNDLAVDVVDFSIQDDYATTYLKDKDTPNQLIHSPYFKTDFLQLTCNRSLDLSQIDSFVIFMCVEGSIQINAAGTTLIMHMGDTCFIPAAIKAVELIASDARIIQVYL